MAFSHLLITPSYSAALSEKWTSENKTLPRAHAEVYVRLQRRCSYADRGCMHMKQNKLNDGVSRILKYDADINFNRNHR